MPEKGKWKCIKCIKSSSHIFM